MGDDSRFQEEIKVGERIRAIRERKGISLQDMAARSGFSSALLNQLENHLISPPLGTLVKLSRALEVDISEFFTDEARAAFTIVRKDERRPISRVASKEGANYGYYYEALAFDKSHRHMEPFLVTLESATKKNQHAYAHEGEEFIFVLEGKMEVKLGDHTDILEPGDSIYYDSTIPHTVQSMDEKGARILAVLWAPKEKE